MQLEAPKRGFCESQGFAEASRTHSGQTTAGHPSLSCSSSCLLRQSCEISLPGICTTSEVVQTRMEKKQESSRIKSCHTPLITTILQVRLIRPDDTHLFRRQVMSRFNVSTRFTCFSALPELESSSLFGYKFRRPIPDLKQYSTERRHRSKSEMVPQREPLIFIISFCCSSTLTHISTPLSILSARRKIVLPPV